MWCAISVEGLAFELKGGVLLYFSTSFEILDIRDEILDIRDDWNHRK